jgi:glycosyltransferase involved in cell wall biosynthesis
MITRPYRVLMVTPSFYPLVGGTETVVMELTKHLNLAGVRTDVLTISMERKWRPRWEWSTETHEGFTIHRVPALQPFLHVPNPLAHLFNMHVIPSPAMRNILHEYQLLHFHDSVDLSLPVSSFFTRPKKVFHDHTLAEIYKIYSQNSLKRFLLRHSADCHLTVSRETHALARSLGIRTVHVLPNGVDPDAFTFHPGGREDNLLVFVGRFDQRKGIHVLIEALGFIGRPVRLVLIGPNTGDAYFHELTRLMAKVNEGGKHDVRYLGSLSQADLISWLHRATLFICPSLVESFGIVNLEAMACGAPVIASDIEGIRDIIRPGQDGILVEPENPSRLAASIESLLQDPAERQQLSLRGRSRVELEFSWRAITKRLITIYDTLLEQVNPGAGELPGDTTEDVPDNLYGIPSGN